MSITLQTIKDRSDEVGECWLWAGATSNTGHPIVKIKGCGCKLVRRVSFILNGGELAARQPVVPMCNEKLCVNPEHLEVSTTKKIAKKAAKEGKFSTLQRCAAISRGQGYRKKLSDDAANEIRYSEESGPVLADRHGIHKSLVNRIKRNEARKDYNNPYLQLVAA